MRPDSNPAGTDLDLDPADDETVDGGGPQRSIALTDGVVAIALTLLALDLKPDLSKDAGSRELASYLGAHAAQYAAFAIAFALIAQFWFVHHRLTRTVRRATPAMHGVTMVFLFGITVIPLTTYVTGNFSSPLATTLFAANIAFVSLSLSLLGEQVHRHGLDERSEPVIARRRRHARSVTTLVIPAIVAGLAWVIGGGAAWFFLLFIVADWPGGFVTRTRPIGPAAAAG